MRNRVVIGSLGVIGVVLAGIVTLVVLNWDTVSANLLEAWDERAEKTQVALFRWGELMSIGAALKDEFGVEPDVTYHTETADRTLAITFSDYSVPESASARDHARAIAAFAVGTTKKSDRIDVVRVVFGSRSEGGGGGASGGSGSYGFALNELKPNSPGAKAADSRDTDPE